MSISNNKVQPAITNYIGVEKLNRKAAGTNKKRKTISGELPLSKQQNPETTTSDPVPSNASVSTMIKPMMKAPITTQTKTNEKLEEIEWDSLSEEDR